MASCANPAEDGTIEIQTLIINPQLTELYLHAITCGTFIGLDVYVGDEYANGADPRNFDHLIGTNSPCEGTDNCGDDTGNIGKSYIDVYIPAEALDRDLLDTFVVIVLRNERCIKTPVIEHGIGEIVPCNGEGIPPFDPELDGVRVTEEGIPTGVASFASIYPCLTHKVLTVKDNCTACNGLDDALTLDLLIKSVSIYLAIDRVAEAYNAFHKAEMMCQDYEDLYVKGPTMCQKFGGIGCWIIDKNFVVTPKW